MGEATPLDDLAAFFSNLPAHRNSHSYTLRKPGDLLFPGENPARIDEDNRETLRRHKENLLEPVRNRLPGLIHAASHYAAARGIDLPTLRKCRGEWTDAAEKIVLWEGAESQGGEDELREMIRVACRSIEDLKADVELINAATGPGSRIQPVQSGAARSPLPKPEPALSTARIDREPRPSLIQRPKVAETRELVRDIEAVIGDIYQAKSQADLITVLEALYPRFGRLDVWAKRSELREAIWAKMAVLGLNPPEKPALRGYEGIAGGDEGRRLAQECRDSTREFLAVAVAHCKAFVEPIVEPPSKSHRLGDTKFTHTPDFNSVRWKGEAFTFTQNQAAIVKALWENHDRGTPDTSFLDLAVNLKISSSRIQDVFKLRNKKHPAMGRMIVSGERKGTYKLDFGDGD